MDELEKKSDIRGFLKKNWAWILLIIMLGFGLYLRTYHIDYPVIGYHNQKEVHYLTETRNFARDGFFKYGFFVPQREGYNDEANPSGIHADSFPLLHIFVVPLFKIFGESLMLARIIGVLFNIGAILFFYLTLKLIFKRDDLPLIFAFIAAINPLLVFYSHNYQLINPALFFMSLSIWLFIRWIIQRKDLFLILSALAFSVSTITKYSFGIAAVIFIFLIPYKKVLEEIKNKKYKNYILTLLILMAIPLWMFYSHVIVHQKYAPPSAGAGVISSIAPSKLFSSQFIAGLRPYWSDSFTLIGVSFAIAGMVLFAVISRKKLMKLENRFLLANIAGIFLFFIVMASKIAGHNYHYYPITPFILIFVSYFILIVSNTVKKIFKSKAIGLVAATILVLAIYPASTDASDRQFNTQFYGLDIAGEYIEQNKLPDDELINSGHQSFGIIWYGDIESTRNLPKNISEFKQIEETRNINWLFLYQWGLSFTNDPDILKHVEENYELKQIAFLLDGKKASPVYLLFKKGGTFNSSQLNSLISEQEVETREYETTKDIIRLSYVTLP